jgi:predicted metal-dependent HD superfamily phosphohydrolase
MLAAARPLSDELRPYYAEPHRDYHTFAHIHAACGVRN